MQKITKRVASAIMCIFLVVALFTSVFFVVENAHHQCTNKEGCPICAEIVQSLNFIAGIRLLPAPAILIIIAQMAFFVVQDICQQLDNHTTLISLKVELLD